MLSTTIRIFPLVFSIFCGNLINSCGKGVASSNQSNVSGSKSGTNLISAATIEIEAKARVNFSFVFQSLNSGNFNPYEFQAKFPIHPGIDSVSLDLAGCQSGNEKIDFSPGIDMPRMTLGDSNCTIRLNSFRYEGLDYSPLDIAQNWSDGDVHMFVSEANRIKILVKKGLRKSLKAKESLVFLFAKQNEPLSKYFATEFVGDSYNLTTTNEKAPGLQIASMKATSENENKTLSLDLLLHCDEPLVEEEKGALCDGQRLLEMGYGFIVHQGSEFLKTAEVIEAAKGRKAISHEQVLGPGERGLKNGGVNLTQLDLKIPIDETDAQVFFYLAAKNSNFRYISLDLSEILRTLEVSRDSL